ncbi:LutC/YkgG family protein [Streptomyces sp. NPDC055078]
MTSARDRVLARIRTAVAHSPEVPAPGRDYLTAHTSGDPAALLDLLDRNLTEYRARVHRTTPARLPGLLAGILDTHGARSVAVPAGLPTGWLAGSTAEPRHDDGPLTPAELDATDAVVTGCALAIAETGTIVLNGGPGHGRRALTLVPDLHICVIHAPEQIVASVPLAMPRLEPTRPQTWISGPSATSDIELDRVEGVHGPRRLEVVLVVRE